MRRILFVCTGNICRSPTGEAVLRHVVKQRNLDDMIETDSVGTHAYHVDEAPDNRSIKAAQKRGIAMHELTARKLEHKDFYDFDVLLGMDSGHVRTLETLKPPEAPCAIALFLDYAGVNDERSGMEVPDPYYREWEDFEHVLDLVEKGVDGLIARIKRED